MKVTIYDVARERGFDVLLTSPYGTPEAFSKSIRTRHKVDGVMFSNVCEYIQPLYEAGFPICYAGHRQPWDVRQVHVYGGFSGYRKEALSLLLSQGCQKIVYFDAMLGFSEVITRRNRAVIEDFVISNGLSPEQVIYMQTETAQCEQAYQKLREMFSAPDRPDGIFVVDGQVASPVYTLLSQCGLRIPEDVKVISSIQSPSEGSLLQPGLTAYLVNSYKMGYNAAVKLIQMIQGGVPDENLTYVPYDFIERGSV